MTATRTALPISSMKPRQYVFCLLGLLLLWPALFNGAPFLFPDTSAYVRGVDAAVLRAVGHSTSWSNDDVRRIAAPKSTTPPSPAADRVVVKPVLLGRSVYYGILLYLSVIFGTLWVAIGIQALVAGAVIVGFVRHIVDPSRERAFAVACAIVTGVIATTTTLPWFASMAMPDVFAGLSIVAAAVLIAGSARETARGLIFWTIVAAYAALVHSSHILILLALACGAFAASLVFKKRWWRGATLLVGAALIGILGEAAFGSAVHSITGTAPIRPPFLTARLVADGPGVRVLRSHCADTRFILCDYVDRLPAPSDSFLWSKSTHDGVFMAVPQSVQRQLAAEQYRFATAVIRYQPGDVLRAMAADIGNQASLFGLPEFAYSRENAATMLPQLPLSYRRYITESNPDQIATTTRVTSIFSVIWLLAGFLLFLISVVKREPNAAIFAACIIVGWLVDVVVCATLSTPHDRYQARVLWVFALVVAMMVARFASHRFDKIGRGAFERADIAPAIASVAP